MNVASGMYHPGRHSCTYKGKSVPCLLKFSVGGGISVHILKNLLRHLDDLRLYENDREYSIILALLVDVHVIHFDMFFENHKRAVVFGLPYVTSLCHIGD